MSEFLGQYKKDYKNIFFDEETEMYRCVKIQTNKLVCLKLINKNELKFKDYNYCLEQIKREEEITKLVCNSENIVNVYQKLETPENIIYELEYCETNLKNYLYDEGPLKRDIELFKNIVISLGKALYTIHKKGIIHRDIRPYNIFIKSLEDEKKIIKLGNFSCSIFIKDNNFEPIGSIFYSAPEIIKNLRYDEKCDLWSLGVTLYELYFGELPYGDEANSYKIKKAIYDKNFIFKKTKIPTLDIFFKRLLTRNPKNRMTFDELFYYIFSNDFMKKDVIYVNNNLIYKNIYENILKEEHIESQSKRYREEGKNEQRAQKEILEKVLNFLEGENFPDIMQFIKENDNKMKYNNIIYYDENIDFMSSVNQDCNYFEKNTTGAFILCTNLDSLTFVKKEILREYKRDKRIVFNLISSGKSFEKLINFLEQNQDFKICIQNACIYCLDKNKYISFKSKYNILYDVYQNQKEVVKFINTFSSNKIEPFPVTKLITYESYIYKDKEKHLIISQYYGDLKKQSFEDNYQKMKSLIEKDNLKIKDKNILIDAFLSFDLSKDVEALDKLKLIIREYTTHKFHRYLNKCLWNLNIDSYDPIAYFTARLMYSLNNFAEKEKKFLIENKNLYRGIQLEYTSLIPYLRAKGKKICLSAFTSTTENIDIGKNFAGRNHSKETYETNLKFSVLFTISNIYKNGWKSSGVDIQKDSKYKKEKEIIFQPFTFYFVKDVKIDFKNYTADIYLETIGKKEILEEQNRLGKNLAYNIKENIIQINN